MSDAQGVDLSGIHRELDRLKNQLCTCHHQGSCMACRGFEVIREQVQVVSAAASQPVLMQVAQEAAIKDMMGQVGGLQEKLAEDPQLQELMSRIMDRVQEDLGGAEGLQELMRNLGLQAGGFDKPDERRSFDDRPHNPENPDSPTSKES